MLQIIPQKAFSKIWILVIIVVLAAGGFLAWQQWGVPEEKSGFIEGSLGYPSESIPVDMKVCAENLVTKNIYCTSTHIKDDKYTHGEGYKIKVPAGDYYVFATTQQDNGYMAYYSDFVICGLKVDCPSHKPIVVAVNSGEIIENIDPQDWYILPEQDKTDN